MSLDVTLTGATTECDCMCSRCLHEHKRKEVEEFYSANITHNLTGMAVAAGIYEVLWRPDEAGLTKASQLIEPLAAGLARMESYPARFKKFSASNGWGTYEQFVPWVRAYLEACKAYPDADVQVSR